MTLNYQDTKMLIENVLATKREEALDILKSRLEDLSRSAQEFYEGVIQHGPFMSYTSDQWLDFHRKIPHWRLRRENALMMKLSPQQREMLE